MKPVRFYDIVVQVALIRPGPIVGKMVHPYLNRRQGREKADCLHPSLEPVLQRTLGVPLFQEQLLRMAMIAAGFTGGEAEELRRAMGFKRSEKRMKDIELKLRAGMERNGIRAQAQEDIVRSITSFALYGFPESHAASFALIAYASAYLKCHYLAEFTCALLNNQPMGFYAPAVLIKDAQRHGLRVLPVDVTVFGVEVYGGARRSAAAGVEVCARVARGGGAGVVARAGGAPLQQRGRSGGAGARVAQGRIEPAGGDRGAECAREAAPAGYLVAGAALDPAGGSAARGVGGDGRGIAVAADDDGGAAVGGLSRHRADGGQASDGVAADRDECARGGAGDASGSAYAMGRWCGSRAAWWCGSVRGRRRASCF